MKRIKKSLSIFLATLIWMLALPVEAFSAMENAAGIFRRGRDGGESVFDSHQGAS